VAVVVGKLVVVGFLAWFVGWHLFWRAEAVVESYVDQPLSPRVQVRLPVRDSVLFEIEDIEDNVDANQPITFPYAQAMHAQLEGVVVERHSDTRFLVFLTRYLVVVLVGISLLRWVLFG
jgi:hypothetical protein